jgi:hypothetical protein
MPFTDFYMFVYDINCILAFIHHSFNEKYLFFTDFSFTCFKL